jgi:endonuclease VIII
MSHSQMVGFSRGKDCAILNLSYFPARLTRLIAMPEGPEIFLAAQAVQEAVALRPISLELHYPILAAKARRVRGVQIKQVRARSKALLTEFANGVVLYSHNQLYGEWVIHPKDEPLLAKQVRLIIHTARQRVVLYSSTDFAWLNVQTQDAHPYIAKLGPEVLSDEVSHDQIRARLALFPRKVVADALLDQHVLAGLGNYLRADILFVAQINPLKKIGALSGAQMSRLAKACKLLPARSVAQKGVIRPLSAYKASVKSGLDFEASRFYVFDREGQACWRCDLPILRVTQGGRGLFYCEQCQA